jgi:hypothetical protein
MNRRSTTRLPYVVALVVLAVALLSGCAAKKGVRPWGDLETGLVLEYGMREGRALSYRMTNDFVQEMTVLGQPMTIESTHLIAFSVEPVGSDDEGQRLGVMITEMDQVVSTPQGDLEIDSSTVEGGAFEMTLSPLGVESGLPDPEVLMFDAGPQGQRSVIPAFSAIFPDMAGRPILAGDTWPTTSVIRETEQATDVTITMNAVNKLEGVETVDGMECARISYTFTGTTEGTGEQQGMPWTMSAELEGTGTIYFAFEEGIFVSDESVGTAAGSMTLTTPDGDMIMPLVRDFTVAARLSE